MKKIMIISAAFAVAFAGCSSLDLKAVRLDGFFGRASEGGVTLGKGNITTIPSSMLYFHAEYNEDTAFLSPSTKIRNWSVTCTGGTNWVPESVANATNTLAAIVREAAESDAKAVTNGTETAEAALH